MSRRREGAKERRERRLRAEARIRLQHTVVEMDVGALTPMPPHRRLLTILGLLRLPPPPLRLLRPAQRPLRHQ